MFRICGKGTLDTLSNQANYHKLGRVLDSPLLDVKCNMPIIQKYNKIYRIQMPKVTPHALRHTFCSRCFEKGITPKVVQQLMGHAHYSTTIDIYTHISEEMMGNELEKFKVAMNA